MRVLLWHVHGSYTDSLVRGEHDYLVPVTPDRGPDGRGRARTYDWPSSVREVTPAELGEEAIDVVVLQRPGEVELCAEWTGRRAGADVPAVYLEHNTPAGHVPCTRHPLAGQDAIPVVHVTHFNALMWDTCGARTTVVEHGVPDLGHTWVGDLERAAVVVNEPVRRGRAVGADLLPLFAGSTPLDVFGKDACELPGSITPYDLTRDDLHAALAHRRVYLHTTRWTSLGLSLLEAMMLGMPVVALATTEAVSAVPPEAGVTTLRPDELVSAVRHFVDDPAAAAAAGAAARDHVLTHYALAPFLDHWSAVLRAPDAI